jgi:hypothetical protein
MSWVDPSQAIALLSNRILYGDSFNDKANIQDYLTNNGMPQSQINTSLAPQMASDVGREVAFNANNSSMYDSNAVKNGVDYLQSLGVSPNDINSQIKSSAQGFLNADNAAKSLQQENSNPGGFTGAIDKLALAGALGVVTGGLGAALGDTLGLASATSNSGLGDLGLTGNEASDLSSFTTPSDTSYLDNYSVDTSTPTSTPISTDTLPVSSDITSPQDLANALRNTDVTVPQNIGLTGNEATDLSSFTTPTDTSYLNDYAPTDTGTAQIGSGTSLSANAANNPLNQFYNVANPEVQANTGTVSNLVGGGSDANLATLNSLSNNPLLPISGQGIGGAELGATGSIIGSGEGLGTQTLSDTLAPTGLNGVTVNDLQTQPTDIANPSVTASDVVDAAKTAKNIANLLKATKASQQQISNTQQNLAKSQALSNLLRGTQAQAVEAPPIYKAQNPFTFSPQEPIQGNPLASLLRNNYGNS